MSEPEILRRCPKCGASIRARVFFCPQCGKDLSREGPEAGVESASAEQNSLSVENSRATVAPGAETMAEASGDADRPGAGPTDLRAEHRSSVSDHRATAAADDVLEDNMRPRVEKLSRTSNVVLDEAGYDPGLRFLLVAVVLFVLFLVLLFLSKWLG